MKKYLLFIIIILIISGCSSDLSKENSIVEAKNITCDKKEQYMKNKNTYLIDVRTESEYNEKHLKDAINIPLDNLLSDIKVNNSIDKNSTIIVYCKSGKRSFEAGKLLKKEGYKNTYNLGSMSNCYKK